MNGELKWWFGHNKCHKVSSFDERIETFDEGPREEDCSECILHVNCVQSVMPHELLQC